MCQTQIKIENEENTPIRAIVSQLILHGRRTPRLRIGAADGDDFEIEIARYTLGPQGNLANIVQIGGRGAYFRVRGAARHGRFAGCRIPRVGKCLNGDESMRVVNTSCHRTIKIKRFVH